MTLAANNLTEQAQLAYEEARKLTAGIPDLTANLKTLNLAAEEKEGILYNLTPAYRHKYLKAVEKHVEELGAKAKEYKK